MFHAIGEADDVAAQAFHVETADRPGQGDPILEHPENPVDHAAAAEGHVLSFLRLELVAVVLHVFDGLSADFLVFARDDGIFLLEAEQRINGGDAAEKDGDLDERIVAVLEKGVYAGSLGGPSQDQDAEHECKQDAEIKEVFDGADDIFHGHVGFMIGTKIRKKLRVRYTNLHSSHLLLE